MGKAIPSGHPAAAMRSPDRHLRALLAIAMIAVVGLTAAVVILATEDGGTTTAASPASRVDTPAQATPAQRADGGPDESSVAAAVGSQPTTAGPEESGIAAAIGSGRELSPIRIRPDESSVAAAITGR